MKRHLFNVLAGVSLVLCVATVVLWARSFWCADAFGAGRWWLVSGQGKLGLQYAGVPYETIRVMPAMDDGITDRVLGNGGITGVAVLTLR